MKKIVVLGAGLVGKAIAKDLSHNHAVTSVDIDQTALQALANESTVKTITADLSDENILKNIINDCDLVIGAVPGFMGFKMLETVVKAGKNIVDISFFDEDAHDTTALDKIAQETGVTAVIDCGVAPGMGNIILGAHTLKMQVENYECYVGGLPKVRTLPFEYKAPFSPIDVIEEYTRPARIQENGQVVIKAALTEPELIFFENIGTLEAFNTDGLRTLLKTMNIPNMKEKTLRYKGHIDYMRMLRDSGFFSEETMNVKGTKIRPIDLTAKLLFSQWELKPNEAEFTVMKVIMEGNAAGKPQKAVYHLYDVYDEATQTSSMARTTGYTCTAVANLVLDGKFTRKGICPPEYVGMEAGCLEATLEYLAERGVHYQSEIN